MWIPEDTKVVSWSNNDEVQLRRETNCKEIQKDDLDKLYENWIDCQKIFGEKMKTTKCYRLKEALVLADINYDEGDHDGLVDARNTARLFAKMEREPELKLNRYYQQLQAQEESSFGFSLGSLMKNLNLQTIGKMEQQPEYSRKLGVEDASAFRKMKQREKKAEE